MLDFYKEFFLEMQGITPKKKLNKNLKDENDNQKPIINIKYRILIWIIGFFYLMIAFTGITSSLKSDSYFLLIKYILLILFDILSMILCLFKNKNIQKVALASLFIFITLNFI